MSEPTAPAPDEEQTHEDPPAQPVADPENPEHAPEDPEADTDGPSDDEATGADDTDDGAEGESSPDEAPPAPSQPDSAAHIEAISRGLERAAKNYVKRVGEVLAEDAAGIVPCPLCATDFPGLLTPAPRSDDVIAAVRPMIGLPDLSTYREDRYARTCERCDGLGKTLTGSRVPAYATITCPECKGAGFRSAESPSPVAAVSNGHDAPPAPTHVDDAPLPAMSEASLEALEKMVAEGRAALAGLR